MDAALGRAPADRRGRRDPVRAARRHDDGRGGRAGAGVRQAGRGPLRPARLPLRRSRATRSERVKLADVRRGQYEGLKTEIDQRGREPDFGPARMHPSAGAVAVGARPFLIAYNINLESPDKDLAVRIARRIRESGGGLPRVQANGFFIEELGRAQVSMNVLDFRIDAALARLGDGPRGGGRGRDRARGVGADRAGAARRVPRRRRPRRGARRRTGRRAPRGRGRLPPAARLLAAAGARAPPRRRASRQRRTDGRPGVTFRVIPGGRGEGAGARAARRRGRPRS